MASNIKICFCILLLLCLDGVSSYVTAEGEEHGNRDKEHEMVQRADCKCTNGKCSKGDDGKEVCMCREGYGPLTEDSKSVTECRKCDCKPGFTCYFKREGLIFKTWEQYCTCPKGFQEINGECKNKGVVKCKNGKSVKRDNDREICICDEGYGPLTKGSEPVSECRKCNCKEGLTCHFKFDSGLFFITNWKQHCTSPNGSKEISKDSKYCKCTNGKCLKGDDGKEACTCKEGYGPLRGDSKPLNECRKCNCKTGFACHFKREGWFFKTWEQYCTCPKGFQEINGECKRMMFQTKACTGGRRNIVDGREVCTCPAGYTLHDGVCRAH